MWDKLKTVLGSKTLWFGLLLAAVNVVCDAAGVSSETKANILYLLSAIGVTTGATARALNR